MQIQKVVLKNYRCLENSLIDLNPQLNIVVGNNECGKSTFLEAINLCLTGYINGRAVHSEIHPYLFSATVVEAYVQDVKGGKNPVPPSILIELYFPDEDELSALKGRNNSLREEIPGVTMSIEFNPDYNTEYAAYIADKARLKTLPVEYYVCRWRSFAGNDVTSRSIPIKVSFIDASTIRNNAAASRYVIEMVRECLSERERVDLALSYRLMKDKFLDDPKVQAVNVDLGRRVGHISDKTLKVSLDTSSRANWESGIMPHLDDIPMTLAGKGEQNSVKIKLAMESSAKSHLVMIEEAENHLSFSSLNSLIKHISDRRGSRQLIVTTHNSFVLNKLGIDSVLLFMNGKVATLNELKEKDTQDYFLKLPGHDTLRLILAKNVILVEGPSDELIVQKAYFKKHGRLPLENNVDVITVSSLAFKRFLEIADLLDVRVCVVTDNDGDVESIKKKYKSYLEHQRIHIHYDDDESVQTLEPQLVKINGLTTVNSVLGTNYANEADLLKFMKANKTECALKFFETELDWKIPEYIARAIA